MWPKVKYFDWLNYNCCFQARSHLYKFWNQIGTVGHTILPKIVENLFLKVDHLHVPSVTGLEALPTVWEPWIVPFGSGFDLLSDSWIAFSKNAFRWIFLLAVTVTSTRLAARPRRSEEEMQRIGGTSIGGGEPDAVRWNSFSIGRTTSREPHDRTDGLYLMKIVFHFIINFR